MTVRNQTAEIFLYDAIDPFWGIGAKEFAADLRALGDVEKIDLRINSPGGDVFDGMAMYNLLRDHAADVTTRVDGLAASAASVVAMAGDTVSMAENAMMMIHNPFTLAVGDAEEFRRTADTLDAVKAQIVGTYQTRVDLSADEIGELMDAETWMDATEAVEKGFASESTESMAVAASFDLSRFQNVPKNWGQQPATDPDALPWRRMALKRKLEIAKRI